jgi:hypothetical protein
MDHEDLPDGPADLVGELNAAGNLWHLYTPYFAEIFS